MFHLSVFIALLLSCCLSPVPFLLKEERLGWSLSVALTFVGRSCLPPVYEADFFFLYPASFFRMTVHTNICRTFFFHVDTTAGHWFLFFRIVVTTLKNANAKGTFFFSSWSVKSLLISFSDYFPLPFRFRWKKLFVYSSHLFLEY